MPPVGTYLFVSANGSKARVPFFHCADSNVAPRVLNLLRAQFPNDDVAFSEQAGATSGDMWVLWDSSLADLENGHQRALVECIEVSDNPFDRMGIERQLDEGYPPGDPSRYARAASWIEAGLQPPERVVEDAVLVNKDTEVWMRSDDAVQLSGLHADTIRKRANREGWPTKRSGRMYVYPRSRLESAWPNKQFRAEGSGR